MTMIVLVPSRGRPQSIARLRRAWADTGATADLMVLVDDDDPTLPQYGPDVVVGPRRRIGPLLNRAAMSVAGMYDVVGFMGDDHLPRTPGWDASIAEASTPWSVVYGNDLLQGERLPTAAFLGSGLVRSLGWFATPGCEHLYLDDTWRLLGERLGTLTYLPDVIIEHLHYLAGKSPKDALYAEVNAPAMYAGDRAAFDRWLLDAADEDILRVRAAMAA